MPPVSPRALLPASGACRRCCLATAAGNGVAVAPLYRACRRVRRSLVQKIEPGLRCEKCPPHQDRKLLTIIVKPLDNFQVVLRGAVEGGKPLSNRVLNVKPDFGMS